jgi:hypothetical protein
MRINAELRKIREDYENDLRAETPKLGELGVVSLSKGESKKLQHTIAWRKYEGPKGKEDELQVKVSASDPSLMVPPELTLTFEKNQFRFDYEIKAGQKAGDFTMTVTPAVGKAVTVQVSVK